MDLETVRLVNQDVKHLRRKQIKDRLRLYQRLKAEKNFAFIDHTKLVLFIYLNLAEFPLLLKHIVELLGDFVLDLSDLRIDPIMRTPQPQHINTLHQHFGRLS
jgi:hypothetical protein